MLVGRHDPHEEPDHQDFDDEADLWHCDDCGEGFGHRHDLDDQWRCSDCANEARLNSDHERAELSNKVGI